MAIYKKSLSGQEEIRNDERNLSLRHRQVLILIDGKRNAEELRGLLQNENVGMIITELEACGYIICEHSGKPSTTHTRPTEITRLVNQPNLTSLQIDTIRRILLASTDQYLGIMGKSIKQHVEVATESESLRACISEWHMAMRESKLGRSISHELMDEIQRLCDATEIAEEADSG